MRNCRPFRYEKRYFREYISDNDCLLLLSCACDHRNPARSSSQKVFGRLRRPTSRLAILSRFPSRPSAFPGSWMIRLKKRRKRRRRGRLFPCAVFSSGCFPRAIGRNCFAGQSAAEPLFRAGRSFFPKRKICSILTPFSARKRFWRLFRRRACGFFAAADGKNLENTFFVSNRFQRSRIISYIMIPAATAALSDSALPRMGSFTKASAWARTASEMPCASLPMTSIKRPPSGGRA